MKWFEFVWKTVNEISNTNNIQRMVVLMLFPMQIYLYTMVKCLVLMQTSGHPATKKITGQIFDSFLVVIYEQDAVTKAHMPWL